MTHETIKARFILGFSHDLLQLFSKVKHPLEGIVILFSTWRSLPYAAQGPRRDLAHLEPAASLGRHYQPRYKVISMSRIQSAVGK